MENEVVIHVRAENHTREGFDGARRETKKWSEDAVKAGVKAGADTGEGFASSMAQGVRDMSANMMPVIAGLGVVLSPMIGGLISAAVVGGAGAAGIVGGLAIAARDPRVQAAGKSLAATVGADLKDAAKPFVPAALGAINQVKAGFKGLLPDIRSIFATTAPLVGPLVHAAVDAVHSVVVGIRNAAAASGPVFAALGSMTESLGSAVGNMFSTLAGDAGAGASAVKDLTQDMVSLINTVTFVVDGLAHIKSALDSFDHGIDSVRNHIEDALSNSRVQFDITADGYKHGTEAAKLYSAGVIGAAGTVNDYNHYLKTAAGQTGQFTGATQDATGAVNSAADALAAENSLLQSEADALKAATDPAFALYDAQDQLNRAQKTYNTALREHGARSAEARQAQHALDKATIGLVDSTAKAGAGTGHLTKEQKDLMTAAGISKSRIKELDTALYNAWKRAQRLDGLNVDINVRYHRSVSGPELLNQSGHRIGGYASGGIKGAASGMLGSGVTWVGEHGPELVNLPPGTRVNSNPDSMRMASAGGHGPVELLLRAAPTAEKTLMQALIRGLQFEVRARGGNVQQVLGVVGR